MSEDVTQKLSAWLKSFDQVLQRSDIDAAANLFSDECYWRDLVAFTWNIATLEGRTHIKGMLRANLQAIQPRNWVLIEDSVKYTDDIIEGAFSFETERMRGKGYLRLKDGKCWTLMTSAEELKGFEEPTGERRNEGIIHKAKKHRESWRDLRQREADELGYGEQPYCLIVGGSQGGLALAARMKQLQVPTLVVDALPKPGDAWRSRYNSLYLHDPIWMDHLPYINFPQHWPVYIHKDKMGDWLECYSTMMEINFWGSAPVENARFDDEKNEWEVLVLREGKPITLRPKHLVLATGLSGKKYVPKFPGADQFEGMQAHSSDHPGGAGFEGKKCVIVGANNSAHDIAVDLWENDADVTMIQRSSTLVYRASTIRSLGGYNNHEDAEGKGAAAQVFPDLLYMSLPFKVRIKLETATAERVKALDADLYERLRAVGFMLDFGEDGSGIHLKYLRGAGGYYIDVGGSELIASGEIKLKSGVGVAEIKRHSVVLTDGSELEADAIFYATGYGPMQSWAEMLISKEIAEKIGPCWGLGSGTKIDPGPWEGELRNMWKPTKQEGLWFHAGNLIQSRVHSLHLALQIKARMEGLPTPVFQTPLR